MAVLSQNTFTTTFLINNIHCSSCISYAQDVLRPIQGIVRTDFSIIDHRVRIQHHGDIAANLARSLIGAAFEVDYISASDAQGQQVRAYATKHDPVSLPGPLLTWRPFMTKAQRLHFENCASCREARSWSSIRRSALIRISSLRQKIRSEPSLERTQSVAPQTQDNSICNDGVTHLVAKVESDDFKSGRFAATIIIAGMTCASCTSAVAEEINGLDYVESVQVNLLANSAIVVYHGPKSLAHDIAEAIDDVGFEAQVDNIVQVQAASENSSLWKAVLSIDGMTCGSCTGHLTEALRSLPYVRDVHVDLVSNSATVMYEGSQDATKLIETVDDTGFDATIVSCERVDGPTKAAGRAVEIQIKGMYCPKCPANVVAALATAFGDAVTTTQQLSIHRPRITITYVPAPPKLTIRQIVDTIDNVDPSISASVYQAPSVDERSQIIRRRERNRIFRHLVLTFLAAIPSLVIGVVYMDLVSSANPTRQWFYEPMWSGTAMRVDWAMFITTTPVMFYGAAIFHSKALKEIWALWRPKSKVPLFRRFYKFGSMNLLLSLGTSVAYFSSLAVLILDATTSVSSTVAASHSRQSSTYFDTVTFLTLFILCGKLLEAYSKAKTGDAVAMLADLRPKEALLVELEAKTGKSTVRTVARDLLEIGDVIVVPHGASPPIDGSVSQSGSFQFDESSLTGESRPVEKTKGDKVFTGSINLSGPVQVTVLEIGGKSMLDQIVNVVREGQAKRAPIERLADVLTGYFTPIITLLAVLTWVIWLVLGQSGTLPRTWLDVSQGGWPFWSVEFAIAVFVVACPCGIGLAAPTALFVGGGLAAQLGILVQGGGEAFQEASRLNTIVFDKTGTLTEGKMQVTDVAFVTAADDNQKSTALLLAKALEDASTHPIAAAIASHCSAAVVGNDEVTIVSADVTELPGQGMKGTFRVSHPGGSTTYEAILGNERLHEFSQNPFVAERLLRFQNLGCSTAILAIRPENITDLIPTAVFAITDPLRAEAPYVLASLRDRGISVHMCTGDNATTARAVAAQLDIPVSQVRAGALPQEKASYIESLQNVDDKRNRKVVGFVGDGTNDTPALTVADVSIAVAHPSGGGSDIALTSSSFVLLNAQLDSVLILVRLSRRVFRRVKMNFAWAALYNLCLIPVAAGVFFPVGANEHHGGFRLSPVWASAAMACSSVSVVLSSLALRLPEIEFSSFRRKK